MLAYCGPTSSQGRSQRSSDIGLLLTQRLQRWPNINPHNAEIFCINHGDQSVCFNLKSS